MSAYRDDSAKLIDFTQSEIKGYLKKFRQCISDGKYSISQNNNRQENIDFMYEYKIDTKKEKSILLSLNSGDFCYAVKNDHANYAHEVLYIFCKPYKLDHWGTLKTVDIYIKVNMIKSKIGDTYVVVVSFHKRNYEIKYLFK